MPLSARTRLGPYERFSIAARSWSAIPSARWRTYTRQSVRVVGRYDQGEDGLPGFPHPVERRRPRHPDPQTGSGGIRHAAVIPIRRKGMKLRQEQPSLLLAL